MDSSIIIQGEGPHSTIRSLMAEEVDLCMSKGKQPRTRVKVPKLLLSETKEVSI